MSPRPKDRHLVGAGAAACAVCCVPPLLALIGIGGVVATLATIASAGLVFGVVVGVGALLAFMAQRRRRGRRAGAPMSAGPVDVGITPSRPQKAPTSGTRTTGTTTR